MKTYSFKHVSASIDDFECEVLFSDIKFKNSYPTLNDHYLLLRFSEDDDTEIEGNFCYLESNDESIVGYYRKMDAKLFSTMLFILPRGAESIEIKFHANQRQLRSLRNAIEGLIHGLGKFESYI